MPSRQTMSSCLSNRLQDGHGRYNTLIHKFSSKGWASVNHKKFKIALIGMAGLQLCVAIPAYAQSSDGSILMRRPLKQLAPTTGTPTATPAPTPTPTPTPGTPTPPVTPDPTDPDVEVIPDPLELCDGKPGSPAPIITNVSWVETGWNPGNMDPENSCVVQTMGYACQASFVCQAGGENSSFTSVAPDSLCETYEGGVSYPPQVGDGGGGGNPGIPPGLCEEPGELGPRYRVCGDFDESILYPFGCVVNGYVEFGQICGGDTPELPGPVDSGPPPS